jgi:uncharacterized protein YecE (DUF72 family)
VIRVGIGGWNFAPWRGTFFPKELRQADELAYASRRLSVIEVNATFYRTQSAKTFRRWAEEVPSDFVFSLKAHRVATHRRDLAEAGSAIKRFLDSGLVDLGPKLGPILWQFPPTKRYDPADFEAFLALLPRRIGLMALRHVVEVRHESFCDPGFISALRAYGVALCVADSPKYPMIGDVTASFAYLRLQRSRETEKAGYPSKEMAMWAQRIETLAAGRTPEDLPTFSPIAANAQPRDCFVLMIDGAKERAPSAAMALLKRLGLALPEPTI